MLCERIAHPGCWSHVAQSGEPDRPGGSRRQTCQSRRVHMTQLVNHAPPSIAQNGWPALVLNADFRPLSYYPLSLWPWQEVVKSVFLERVDVIAEYDEYVHSPSITMRLPSVIALREFVTQDRPPAVTRFHAFPREGFQRGYCGSHEAPTFDPPAPRWQGGRS